MRTALLSTVCISQAITAIGQQEVQLRVNSVPPGTDAIYAAGSFNNWNPADEQYKLQKTNGSFFLSLKLSPGSYEYKLTRGNWTSVECSAAGASIGNRMLSVPAGGLISLTVAAWQDAFSAAPKKSTASENVHIIDTAFYIPQLKRTRRIWVYLPAQYKNNPGLRLPVLYMQDGQNLFDERTAYAGEWGIDEYFDKTKQPPCIVVGIDNGGDKRLNEYNPYDNKRFGKGEGNAYEAFLVYTLKPFIDQHFRTLPDKAHTYIAGSSMGGLISFYTALHYPKVFGSVGVFSPSFWIDGNEVAKDISRLAGRFAGNMYCYVGGGEDKEMITGMANAATLLKKYPRINVKTSVNPTAKHNETAWGQEFPAFYEWVVKNSK